MRFFFVVVAIFTALLGVVWVFFPETMLGSWDVKADGVAAYMGRRYGGLFFGYSVILWLSRNAGPSQLRRAILAGSAVVTGVVGILSVIGAVSRVVGPGVWGAGAAEIALAGAFGYFWFATRDSRAGEKREA